MQGFEIAELARGVPDDVFCIARRLKRKMCRLYVIRKRVNDVAFYAGASSCLIYVLALAATAIMSSSWLARNGQENFFLAISSACAFGLMVKVGALFFYREERAEILAGVRFHMKVEDNLQALRFIAEAEPALHACLPRVMRKNIEQSASLAYSVDASA